MIAKKFVTVAVSIYLLSILSGVFARRTDKKLHKITKRSQQNQPKDTADPSHFATINAMTYSHDEPEYSSYDEDTGNKKSMGSETAYERTEEKNLYDDYANIDTDQLDNEDDMLRKYYGLGLRRAAYDDYDAMDVLQLMRTGSGKSRFMRRLIPDFANDQPYSDSADDKNDESSEYGGIEDDMYVD